MEFPNLRSLWYERRPTARREIFTLVLLMIVFGGGWGFVELAGEMREGDTQGFDEGIMLALRTPGQPDDPVGPTWFEEVARDVTALGGMTVLILLTLGTAGYLFMEHKPRAAWLLLLSIVTGMVLSFVLKEGFDRPRPDLVPHATEVYTSSFPSAHSMLAAVVYLTLGSMLVRLHARWPVKVYAMALAVVLTLAVGVSRVYLGVHWPTDVLAGWAGGAAWAILWWAVIRLLQKRGDVEEEGQEPEVAAEQARATAEALETEAPAGNLGSGAG
jgi:undecaprenyl-diphosphatase